MGLPPSDDDIDRLLAVMFPRKVIVPAVVILKLLSVAIAPSNDTVPAPVSLMVRLSDGVAVTEFSVIPLVPLSVSPILAALRVKVPSYACPLVVVTFPPREVVPLTFNAVKLVAVPTLPSKTALDTVLTPALPIFNVSAPFTVLPNVIESAAPLFAVSVMGEMLRITAPVYV